MCVHGASGAFRRVRERVRQPGRDLDRQPASDPPLPDAERPHDGRAQHVLADRAAPLRPAGASFTTIRIGPRPRHELASNRGCPPRRCSRWPSSRSCAPRRSTIRGASAPPRSMPRRSSSPKRSARRSIHSTPAAGRGGSLQPRGRVGPPTRAGRRGGAAQEGLDLPFGHFTAEPGDASRPGRLRDQSVRSVAELVVVGIRNRYRRPGIGAPLAATLTPTPASAAQPVPMTPTRTYRSPR